MGVRADYASTYEWCSREESHLRRRTARVYCSSLERGWRSRASFPTCEISALSMSSRPCWSIRPECHADLQDQGHASRALFLLVGRCGWSSFRMSPSSSERGRWARAGTVFLHGAGSPAYRSSSGSGRIAQTPAPVPSPRRATAEKFGQQFPWVRRRDQDAQQPIESEYY